MMLVDSHCHLDFPEFADDLDGVVRRGEAAGVGLFLTISTKLSGFRKVAAVAERFPNVYCTVGVHPHEAEGELPKSADEVIALAAHPKTVGIGETGLDYFYEHSPKDEQRQNFRLHIEAARATGLPIVVHTRDADEETSEILADEMGKGAFTGLLHCFSSGPELARKALDLGFYISISGIVTFNKAEELREIVAEVPLDRLLVETDAPFLAPVPHRGKTNEPAFVAETAKKVAEIKGIGVDELASATTANFRRLFTRVPDAAFRAA